MKGTNVIELHLITYPEKFESVCIKTYGSFNEELKDLLDKSGYVQQFKKIYFRALDFININGSKCFMNTTLFERLKDSDGINSIKLKGEKNIRILFAFKEINQREIAILLTCFQEKRTKDYKDEIIVAKKRLKEWSS